MVTLSSAEAELGGVVYGACEGLGVQAVAVDLGISTTVRLRADSAAAIGICNRTGIGRVRHLAVGQLWIQERIRSGGLALRKVLGTENPADALTKHLGAGPLRADLGMMAANLRSGRSAAAPALAADIVPFLADKAPQRRTQRERRGGGRRREQEEVTRYD